MLQPFNHDSTFYIICQKRIAAVQYYWHRQIPYSMDIFIYSLILKLDNPSIPKHYCLTGLYNVLRPFLAAYLLLNRMKGALDMWLRTDLHCWCVFHRCSCGLGRVHSMEVDTETGWMMLLKLCIKHSSDRMWWAFVEFSFQHWVMEMYMRFYFAVLLNGSPTQQIISVEKFSQRDFGKFLWKIKILNLVDQPLTVSNWARLFSDQNQGKTITESCAPTLWASKYPSFQCLLVFLRVSPQILLKWMSMFLSFSTWKGHGMVKYCRSYSQDSEPERY